MKNLLLLNLLISSCSLFSQSAIDVQQRIWMSYRPGFTAVDSSFATYDFKNEMVNTKLKEALRYGEKSTGNTTCGILLVAGGSAMILGGILHKVPKGIDGLFDFTKPTLIVTGTIPIILSILPFHAASKNNERRVIAIRNAGALLMR